MDGAEKPLSQIYTLKKEELQVELQNRGLDPSGTVEELRKRLSQAVKAARASNQDTEESQEEHNGDTDLSEETDSQASAQTSKASQRTTSPRMTDAASSTPRLSDGDIMDKVRKWNVRFDKGQDPLAFLERVEELATCYEIPIQRLYKALPELLTKDALAWYRNNRSGWSGWDDFLKDFKMFFLPPRYHVKLADEIRSRAQKEGEKFKDFVIAIQSLMRWADNLTDEDKLERIYDNLRPEYRFYIRRPDFKDLGGLVKLAEEFELLKSEEMRAQRQRVNPNGPNPSMRNRVLPITATYSRAECCWRCGQRGHRRTQCRNQPRIFCSRCGRENILSRDCQCPRGPARGGNPLRMPPPGTGGPGRPGTHDTALHNPKLPLIDESSQQENIPDTRYFVPTEILFREYKALIDTGASRSFIGEEIMHQARDLGIPVRECWLRTTLADGGQIPIDRCFDLEVKLAGRTVVHTFYYLPRLTEPIILGVDFLRRCSLQLTLGGEDIIREELEPEFPSDLRTCQVDLPEDPHPDEPDLNNEFPEAQHERFEHRPGLIYSVRHRIRLKEDRPKYEGTARMSIPRKAILVEAPATDPIIRKPSRPRRVPTGTRARADTATSITYAVPAKLATSDSTTEGRNPSARLRPGTPTKGECPRRQPVTYNRPPARPKSDLSSDEPRSPSPKQRILTRIKKYLFIITGFLFLNFFHFPDERGGCNEVTNYRLGDFAKSGKHQIINEQHPREPPKYEAEYEHASEENRSTRRTERKAEYETETRSAAEDSRTYTGFGPAAEVTRRHFGSQHPSTASRRHHFVSCSGDTASRLPI